MRKTLLFIAIILNFSLGCKTSQQGSGCCSHNPQTAIGASTGKVSHQYQSTGCGTVIIVTATDGGEPQVLIPKDPLDKAFDKDGLEIKFNFHLLKMPMREGCTTGMMAEITEISK